MPAPVETIVYGRPVAGVDELCADLHRSLLDSRGTPAAGLHLSPEVVPSLIRARLVVQLHRRLVPGPGVAWISRSVMADLQSVLEPVHARYSAILKGGGVKALSELADSHPRDPSGFVHLLVAGNLLDLGVRRQLLRQGIIRSQPETCWVWGYEAGTPPGGNCGVRLWHRSGLPFGIAQFWGGEGAQGRPHFSGDDLSALASLEEPGSSARFATNLLRLRHWGIVRATPALQMSVPLLKYAASDPIWSAVDRLASTLVSDAIQPAVLPLRILARRLAPVQVDCFLQACTRLILVQTVDRLVQSGLLPPFPGTPARSYGFWVWREDSERPLTSSLGTWLERGVV